MAGSLPSRPWAGLRAALGVGSVVLSVLVGGPAEPAAAQTITGRLIDLEGGQAIPLGLVMMFTESGDSIAATVSDESGHFTIASPEPGSFVLLAAALGYEETPAGVFELGEGASMEVEYRLRGAPLPLEAILVSVERPVIDHHLVRNGFVRRFQRGLGRFVTPHDIEESPARSTEALLTGVPQVRVGMVRSPVGGWALPSPHLGETVQIAGPQGGWCEPTVYVDGVKTYYDPATGFTLSSYAHIGDVEAIEVYRRPAEIPVEFSAAPQTADGSQAGCGVLVVWTKRGPAPGRRALVSRASDRTGQSGDLPPVDVRGHWPVSGERVRVAVAPETAESLGITSPWHGTYVSDDGNVVVVTGEDTGRPVAVPLASVRALQVSREKGPGDAWRRGVLAGAAFGVGTWGFLSLLCAWTCGPDVEEDTLLPGALVSLVAAGIGVARGPGTHWVEAPVPDVGAGPMPGSVELSLRIPTRRR